MEHIIRDQNKMETGMPIDRDFPFGACYKRISQYKNEEVLSHWHMEFEIILVVEGEMNYIGEASEYMLSKGEGVLINANILHSFKKRENQDCLYLVVNFHPSLIGFYEEGRIYNVYFAPYITGKKRFLDIKVDKEIEWQERWMSLLFGIEKCWKVKKDGHELEIQAMLLTCWEQLYNYMLKDRPLQPERDVNTERIYQAVRYIKENLGNKLYLSDVANACNISNTECCRMFKKRVGQSPMEYIMKYRVKKSLDFLDNESLSIRQVGEMAGFESHSYYTKCFRDIMKCTPMEYRKLKSS